MQIAFYYDYGSPASYLAWTQLPSICARNSASIDYHPILLGGIFKTVGTTSPVQVRSKGDWFFKDMQRYAEHYGVPFVKNPHFIINSLPLMRGALWAENEGRLDDYNRMMFEACWVHARNLNDPSEIMAVLAENGFDAEEVAAAIQTDAIKQGLIKATEDAANQGVFGVPTMIVDGVLHFGQDRLDWVERAIATP